MERRTKTITLTETIMIPVMTNRGTTMTATLMLSTRATIVLPVARRVRRHIEIPASSMSRQSRQEFPRGCIET